MTRTLRIALYHNLPSGGGKRAVFEWVRRLAQWHHIDVFTLNTADHDFCDIRPFVKQHHIFEFTAHPLFHSPWGRLNQLQRWRDLGVLTQLGQRIAQKIDAGGYDVVFAHTCMFTFIPTFLRFVQTPSIYYLHEAFGPTYVRHFDRPYLKTTSLRQRVDTIDPLIRLYKQRLTAVQRRSVEQTDLLLANSEFTRAQMKIAFGVETPVCYLGVDAEAFRPFAETRRPNTVFSVGEFSPRKGFAFLVESLGHIPVGQRPKLRLISNSVVPEERAYVQEMATQLGVELELYTRLNTTELAKEYGSAQLCVYAPVLEPFGLVPLEAMASGTPVVGVREGGVAETVVHQQTGLLTERDPAQFAAAVQEMLANPQLMAQYGQNAREHVLRHWTWDQSVASTEQYLYSCANKSTPEF